MTHDTHSPSLKGRLWSLLDPVVSDEGLSLWDLEVTGPAGQPRKLQVYVDRSEGGVTLDDCATLSRRLGAVLDVEGVISNAYNLEVSSPGLDRVLHRAEHYEQYIGEEVRVRLSYAVDGRRNIVGRLQSANEEQVEVDIPDFGLFAVPKPAIRRVNVVAKFPKGRKE